MYCIGLMSGTSLDAVDGVLARFDAGRPVESLAYDSLPLPSDLRAELLALNQSGVNELHRAAVAANQLVDLYAEVVEALLLQSGCRREEVAAIGAHGQTVRHRPELGYTWQLNAPARLVERAGIAVVADFRNRDVAAGGQGAPLVPAFHRAVFGGEVPRVLLNLGGIANVSILPASGNAPADVDWPGELIGFDTGPANMLLDLWCARHLGRSYDADGAWAASGKLHVELCAYLYASEPWFALSPPKSTGRDLFNEAWLDERLEEFARRRAPVAAADVQATLVELTALSASRAIRSVARDTREIYVCGGGASNPVLMQTLAQYLPGRQVQSTQALGVHPQQVESLAFAWLAHAHLTGMAGNVPAVTGARGPRILGAYYPV